MFDVGYALLLLIGVVALIVIGPERLPAVARTAGQWVAKMQRFVRGVKTDLASELESGDLKKLIGDQREQINELRNMVSSAKREFETSTRDAVKGARKSLEQMETSVKELESTQEEALSSGNISLEKRKESSVGSGAGQSSANGPTVTVESSSAQSSSAESSREESTKSIAEDKVRSEIELSKPADTATTLDRTGTESGT